MLSAIISDSLLFKSPTCTEEDVAAAKELAAIAGVDPDKYGLEMLKAGADLSDKTVEQLISFDAKEFQMGNAKVVVAQVNAVDTSEVLARKAELEATINQAISDNGLDLFLFVVTDILNNDSGRPFPWKPLDIVNGLFIRKPFLERRAGFCKETGLISIC